MDNILSLWFFVFERGDAGVHLCEVPLYYGNIFAVSNNLKQIFITYKIKSGKGGPLSF